MKESKDISAALRRVRERLKKFVPSRDAVVKCRALVRLDRYTDARAVIALPGGHWTTLDSRAEPPEGVPLLSVVRGLADLRLIRRGDADVFTEHMHAMWQQRSTENEQSRAREVLERAGYKVTKLRSSK